MMQHGIVIVSFAFSFIEGLFANVPTLCGFFFVDVVKYIFTHVSHSGPKIKECPWWQGKEKFASRKKKNAWIRRCVCEKNSSQKANFFVPQQKKTEDQISFICHLNDTENTLLILKKKRVDTETTETTLRPKWCILTISMRCQLRPHGWLCFLCIMTMTTIHALNARASQTIVCQFSFSPSVIDEIQT